MKTSLTVGVLARILCNRDWSQEDLADKTKLHRSVISMHLSRQRPVRSDHLVNYLEPLEHGDRQALLAAWLRDTLPADLTQDLLGQQEVRTGVKQWSPDLTSDQRDALEWWARCIPHDQELADLFRDISRRFGWRPPPGDDRQCA